ncbi:tetratricopeptide repeat protein [Anaeromyxobacter paludicola]|uniref:tetratricopeptide repeat protein n=1 Tax=Anaeromyxobacter paludicola TaxID=2918171 RepID=UPI0020BEF0B3|nr:tetratricopeptide repeat protein [Anaeromyxobacter paludicola]
MGVAGASEDPRGSGRGALALLGVALLGAAAYANTFQVPFVADDLSSIVDNGLVRDLASYLPGGGGYAAARHRYVTYLTFALNYRLGGLEVAGYHLVNLLVHLANAALLFALVRGLFLAPRLARSALAPRRDAVALLAAALFVAHPLQTGAVTYVVQRLASLATLFYLLAAALYLSWRLRREAGLAAPGRYLGALLATLVAMKTKEIAFTLPLALLLLEASFFGRPGRRAWLGLAPFLLTLAVIPLTLLAPAGGAGLAGAEAAVRAGAWSRHDYLVTQVAVVGTYLRLLVLPVGQNLDHDYPLQTTLFAPALAGPVAAIAGLLGLAAALYRRTGPRAARGLDPAWRLVGFGILWFFLALAVESSVVPIDDLIFEHRVYLPSAGLLAGAAAAAVLGVSRLRPAWRRAGAAALVAVVLALATATFLRNRTWSSAVSLWTDAAAKSPAKARARLNLGKALVEAGRPGDALPEYAAALRLDPGSPDLRNDLGVALLQLGRYDEAIAQLRLAVQLAPDYADAHTNLGMAYARKGLLREATEEMRRGMQLQPGAAPAAP